MEQQDPRKTLWVQKEFYGRPLKFRDPEVRVFFGHTFSLIIRDDLGQPWILQKFGMTGTGLVWIAGMPLVEKW